MTQKPTQIKPCNKKNLLVKPTLSSCPIALSIGPGATKEILPYRKPWSLMLSGLSLWTHLYQPTHYPKWLPLCLHLVFSNYLNWCKTRPMTGTEHINWIRDPTNDSVTCHRRWSATKLIPLKDFSKIQGLKYFGGLTVISR